MGAARDHRVSAASGQSAPCSWEVQGQGAYGHTHSTGTYQGLATSEQPHRSALRVRMVHAVLTRHCIFIQRQHVMAAAHGHGKDGRKKQGQHRPWGYVEDQAPRKVGPLAS